MRSLLLVLALAPLFAQQPVVRTADPVKRGLKDGDIPRVVKVTDNVYTYEDFHPGAEKFMTTNMFVVTSAGVFLADAQGSVAATKGLVDAIAKITPKPITHVAICSDHGDHTAGNSALPAGVQYLIHPTSQAILKGPAGAELVSDRKTTTLGGEEIQTLFLGRAHTGGDLSVYLPKEKILFMSEAFLNRVFPAMRSAYPTEWLATVDKALAMDVKIYIPGHGFTETGPVSREELVAYRGALAAVIAEATRLHKAGVPLADAAKQANWGEYATWTLAASQGPTAIRKVYEELDKKIARYPNPLAPTQGRIYVTVTDSKGSKATPRDAESFHVWENGMSRPIVSASAAVEPPSIIVIIHGFELDETADTRKALTAFVESVRSGAPDARIALVGDVVDPTLTNITANAATLDETARRFAFSGKNMVFYESIVDAAKALGKEASDRRIIVTLTKSTQHDADHQTTAPTVAALKKSGASVWSIDVSPGNASQTKNMHSTSEMDGFVSHASGFTGGAQERIITTLSLPAKMERFANLILSQYQVTFTRPDAKGESELRVGVEGVPGEKVLGPGWFVK